MTLTDTDLTLTVSRTIDAPPERVFDAWLDAEMLMRFMEPGPHTSAPEAKTDPREGGRFEITMKKHDNVIPHSGTYQVIDRPNRLVFTWETSFSAEGSTVTLDFRPDGDGTHVTLTHIRFPNTESRDNHESGWTAILSRLAEVI